MRSGKTTALLAHRGHDDDDDEEDGPTDRSHALADETDLEVSSSLRGTASPSTSPPPNRGDQHRHPIHRHHPNESNRNNRNNNNNNHHGSSRSIGYTTSKDEVGGDDNPTTATYRQQRHENSDRCGEDPAGERKSVWRSGSAVRAAYACLSYSACSVSMILVNKSLSTDYNRHLPAGGDLNTLLVVFQAAVAVALVEACKYCRIIEPYPPIDRRVVRCWAPVNVMFCTMIFAGMASLQTNSVPMVTVFKNVANIVTGIGDYVCFGNRTEPLGIAAFAVMFAGAAFAAGTDLQITLEGLLWMICNICGTSGYVLYMKYATDAIQLSKFGMVYVNNLLCVAFLLPVALYRGEIQLLRQTTALHTWDYVLKNVFAGWIGFFLNFASLNCVQTTGPTTYAIVGSLNKVPVAMIGYLLFDGAISSETWFFVGVNLCGGFLYSYAKLQASNKASEHAAK